MKNIAAAIAELSLSSQWETTGTRKCSTMYLGWKNSILRVEIFRGHYTLCGTKKAVNPWTVKTFCISLPPIMYFSYHEKYTMTTTTCGEFRDIESIGSEEIASYWEVGEEVPTLSLKSRNCLFLSRKEKQAGLKAFALTAAVLQKNSHSRSVYGS